MAESESKSELPPTKLVIRGREGLTGFFGLPSASPHGEEQEGATVSAPVAQISPHEGLRLEGCSAFSFSKDGTLVAGITATGVVVKSTESGAVLLSLEAPNVQAADFSPRGSYLLTWQRPAAAAADREEGDGNLKVINVSTGEVVASYFQKMFRKTQWPSIQWSTTEEICARMVTNEVQILDGHAPLNVLERVRVEGLTVFSLGPNASDSSANIATFVPEKKGKPAAVRVFRYTSGSGCVQTAAKSFYQAQDVNLKWSYNDSVLLVHTHTDVDKTGTSYYGATALYLLHCDGSFDCTVPMSKQGLVHAVDWCPTAHSFIVIAGTMPAQATLYNARAEPQFLFGEAHRNTISWSPHGRFVCLAGFGNLAGEMDFWDRNKFKKMGSATAHTTVDYGWSPDGRYFMTATCAPRMNMDNGFKIFRYNGEGPLVEQRIEPLYEAKWCPAAPGVYPDRPQSPKRKGQQTEEASKAAAPEAKPAVYRPPRSSGTLSAMMRAEREAASGPKKVKGTAAAAPTASAASHQPYIPGLVQAPAPAKAAADKNKKKKKAAGDSTAAAPAAAAPAAAAPAAAAPAAAAPAAAPQEAKQEAKPESKASEATAADADPAKRLKNLKKKLKQIEELKAKAASGETLNADQQGKLASEADIVAEIQRLEI